jgi:hypothetical protein
VRSRRRRLWVCGEIDRRAVDCAATRGPPRREAAIDTPPFEDQAGIASSALCIADVAIVSMAPTMGEYERLPEVWAAINEVEPLRATPLFAAVLMNRTVTNASSTSMFCELMTRPHCSP